MARHTLLTVLLTVLFPSLLSAQEWAEKMFNKTRHDFGTVARGADVEYRFEIQNIYEEAVHIADVRTSCGCTSPSLEGQSLKTWEKGFVVAKFNTRTFRGQHGATLTVTIDEPFRAEVQLRVEGNIRGDVVFSPGSIRFANVDQGREHEQKVRVSYAGRSNWKIEDIKSVSEFFRVEMTEVGREAGKVDYELLVRLSDTAPAGYFSDQLIVVTNDQRDSRIPLDVEGTVVPEISVSPSQLVLGEVPLGEEVSKKLVVKGKNPFRITAVECENGCFTFEADDEAKKIHILTVTFRAESDPGKVEQAIRITTDRGGHIFATLDAYAEIVSSVKSASAEGGDAETPSTVQQAATGS